MEKNPEFLKTNAPPAPMVPPTQPVPQATISRTGSTNQVVMKMTNLSSMPATTAPTNKTATGAASAAPLLIKPAPSTNKP
jgi:hypothetical protein